MVDPSVLQDTTLDRTGRVPHHRTDRRPPPVRPGSNHVGCSCWKRSISRYRGYSRFRMGLRQHCRYRLPCAYAVAASKI